MKRTMKTIAILIALAFGLYAGGFHATPEKAAVSCNEVQQCLTDGYWMESCIAYPNYFITQPKGNYEWGYMQIELRCDPSLGLPPVSITCNIKASNVNGQMRYMENHNNVVVPIR